MDMHINKSTLTVLLPIIPAKRYFTIDEVSKLCQVQPHILRYWEQEFTQLKLINRRSCNRRRYYQHNEVLLIRRIRRLLYEYKLTINDARNKFNNYIFKNLQSNVVIDTIKYASEFDEIEVIRLELLKIQKLLLQKQT